MSQFYIETEYNTACFGTLVCPFITKSLLLLHGFLLTWLFFQSLKKQGKQRTPCIWTIECALQTNTGVIWDSEGPGRNDVLRLDDDFGDRNPERNESYD